MTLIIIFWILLFIIFYTFLGYWMVLYFLNLLKRLLFWKGNVQETPFEPEVTLLIPAYNEAYFIERKIENSLALDYPKNKIKYIFITDGSTDHSPELLTKYPEIVVYHEQKRMGKIGAINRGMTLVNTPIVIFSDANTMLHKNSIKEIVRHFSFDNVGCVAGEKRINRNKDVVNAGEGIYWRIESSVKRLESGIHSAVAAAGELFAIRTSLFEEVESDTILDDLIISLRIAKKGYVIKYAPNAIATENASENISEELKRKIRIASGGFQSLSRLLSLIKPFSLGWVPFAFFSHKFTRWVLAPLALVAIIPINIIIILFFGWGYLFYTGSLFIQSVFYFFAFWGWLRKDDKKSWKLFSVPFYFCLMNYSIYAGFVRFMKKKHSVNWEKAKRS